jgi:hypothetical protein
MAVCCTFVLKYCENVCFYNFYVIFYIHKIPESSVPILSVMLHFIRLVAFTNKTRQTSDKGQVFLQKNLPAWDVFISIRIDFTADVRISDRKIFY